MFTRGRGAKDLSRQLKNLEKNQEKVLKELEIISKQKEKELEILETQVKNNSEHQKALVNSLDTSYAIIEQQDNNCHIMDYWSKAEENKMLKLKSVEIKKTYMEILELII